MTKTLAALSLVLMVSLGCSQSANQAPADQVFLNGKIVTVDADFSIAEAIAVTGDTIVAVGSRSRSGPLGWLNPNAAGLGSICVDVRSQRGGPVQSDRGHTKLPE